MAHKDDFESLSGPLTAALGGIASRGAPAALWPMWHGVAGAAMAAASRPTSFVGGVLVIETESPAWLHALQQQEPLLVERLRSQLPGFARLEFRLRWAPR